MEEQNEDEDGHGDEDGIIKSQKSSPGDFCVHLFGQFASLIHQSNDCI